MRPQTRRPSAALRKSAALLSAALLSAILPALLAAPARAETLRVGKAVGVAFSFVPLDVGIRQGLFAQNGIEVESTTFAGDARLQQAMAADGIDIALGSGPGMAFVAKGSPIKAVAAMAGAPLLLSLIVRPDGPRSVAELKGKTVSVSSAGSLTYWLVSETSRLQGWGPGGDRSPAGGGARLSQGLVCQHRLHAAEQGCHGRDRHGCPGQGPGYHQPEL
jgi:NitT/TauT family transport system substrate-binding protein